MTLERRPAEWTYDPVSGVTRVYLQGEVPSGGAAFMVTVSSVIDFHLDTDGRMVGIEFHADQGEVANLAHLADEDDES